MIAEAFNGAATPFHFQSVLNKAQAFAMLLRFVERRILDPCSLYVLAL